MVPNSANSPGHAADVRIAELEAECARLRKAVAEGKKSSWLRRLERSARLLRKRWLRKVLGHSPAAPAPVQGENLEIPRQRKHRKPPKGPALFNPRYYLLQGPAVQDAAFTPWEHYSTLGWREGFDPLPLFKVSWYLEKHPEVAALGVEPLTYYLATGWKEGHNPHPFFDGAWYRTFYSDVKQAGAEPLEHFLRFGWKEMRLPNAAGEVEWLSPFIIDGSLMNGSEPRRPYIDTLPEDCARLDRTRPTILVISHDASRTGAPIIALTLATHLAGENNVISVLVRGGTLAANFREQSVITIEPGEADRLDAWGLHLWLDLFLQQASIDYAIVNSIESGFLLPQLSRKDIPAVNLIHEFMAYTRPLHKMREAAFHGSVNIFPARLVQQDALQNCPDLWEPGTQILPQGLCPTPRPSLPSAERAEEEKAIRAALRPPGWEEALVVAGIGTVQMRKGVDLFLACAEKILARNPPRSARFVWFGPGYDPESDVGFSVFIADHLRKLGSSGAACVLAAVSQPQLVYQLADVFLLTSRLDPFPLVGQEAMAAGLPVVCFHQATGLAEILQSEPWDAACVAPYLDVEEAARIVQRMRDEPAWRREIGERNRELADRLFDPLPYARKIEAHAAQAGAAKRQEIADRAAISSSGVLDRSFIVSSFHTGVPGDVAGWYARSWASGMNRRKPFPGFHPGIYQEMAGSPGKDPLAHFLAAGKPSGPWQQQVFSPAVAGSLPLARGRAALHIHVFYPEMVDDLCERLQANATPVDLFITTPVEHAAEMERRWAGYDRGAIFYTTVPNRGRDIGALLTGLAESAIWDYDFIGHMHTKQTTWLNHASYVDLWRIFLLEHTLGGHHPMMDFSLSCLASDSQLGLIFPDDPNALFWGPNLPFAETLAASMHFQKPLPQAINFPVGTFFWAKPAALGKLRELDLQWEDYPPEPVAADGSVLHAIERLFPLVAAEAGFASAVTHLQGMTR